MMLILSRKIGEEVAIGNNIRLTVVEIRGNFVRLGLTAAKPIAIRRQELDRLASCRQTTLTPGSKEAWSSGSGARHFRDDSLGLSGGESGWPAPNPAAAAPRSRQGHCCWFSASWRSLLAAFDEATPCRRIKE